VSSRSTTVAVLRAKQTELNEKFTFDYQLRIILNLVCSVRRAISPNESPGFNILTMLSVGKVSFNAFYSASKEETEDTVDLFPGRL